MREQVEAMRRDALLSPCGLYRYRLDRDWEVDSLTGRGRVTWIMLNPSVADAQVDDLTVRKCVGFSQRWGYSGLTIVNLYAWRATDPAELLQCADPAGPGNADHVRHAIRHCDLAVAAWGASRNALLRRADPARGLPRLHVESSTVRGSRLLFCLGRTRDGHPRHPSRLPYSTPLEPYDARPRQPSATEGNHP